jgi:hypothetical protein
MNVGDEPVRDHISAGEVLKVTLRTDVCLYQRFALRPIVTGLFVSRSSTGGNSRRIPQESGHLPTFFFPIYFVQGNKLSAYISIHCASERGRALPASSGCWNLLLR